MCCVCSFGFTLIDLLKYALYENDPQIVILTNIINSEIVVSMVTVIRSFWPQFIVILITYTLGYIMD